MSSSALEVVASIADLDPTGIAPTIFNIVSKIHEQYGQMQGNKEACQSLNKEVEIVSDIVKKLCETKQTGPCQRTLVELTECLTQCLTLISAIGAEKDTIGKIKAFLSAKGNQAVITQLTTQLHSIADILNLALTAQTANSVEKIMALMAEKESENLPSIQQCKSEIHKGVSRLEAEIKTITITTGNNTQSLVNAGTVDTGGGNMVFGNTNVSSQETRQETGHKAEVKMHEESKISAEDLEKLKNLKKSIALGKKISESEAESYYDVLESMGGLNLSGEGGAYVLCSEDGNALGKEQSIQALNRLIGSSPLAATTEPKPAQSGVSLSTGHNKQSLVNSGSVSTGGGAMVFGDTQNIYTPMLKQQ
ncbi:MAG: hypothetical protein KBD03_04990, partial [Gammaproteobacteria bacterium]|nr:hypothetical protein [Gammaproteobacteria bacterium]